MRSAILVVGTLVLATAACGGGAASPAAAGTAASTAPRVARVARGGANVITNAEIEAAPSDANNAYELIERLRPTMLRPRNLSAGAGSTYGIVAYADDVRLGELEALRTVMRGTVYEIRYINATDATTRWGTGHSNGAIQVRLKR